MDGSNFAFGRVFVRMGASASTEIIASWCDIFAMSNDPVKAIQRWSRSFIFLYISTYVHIHCTVYLRA